MPWAVLIQLINLRVSVLRAVLFSQLGSFEIQFVAFTLLHRHYHVAVMSGLKALYK